MSILTCIPQILSLQNDWNRLRSEKKSELLFFHVVLPLLLYRWCEPVMPQVQLRVEKVPETTAAVKWLTSVSYAMMRVGVSNCSRDLQTLMFVLGKDNYTPFSDDGSLLSVFHNKRLNRSASLQKMLYIMVVVKLLDVHCFQTVKWMFLKYIFRRWELSVCLFSAKQ